MERSTRIQVYVLCLIVAGSIMTVGYQAYATSCYTRFVFNWFSLNTILQCLDTNATGVTLFSQLHDVFFSNLHSNQVAVYNGSKWVNQNVSTFADTTTCSNLDTTNGGYGIVKNYTSGNCNFKSIKPSTGISMTNNSQNILISNTGIISASCSNGVSCSGTNPLKVNGSSLQNQETTVCSSVGVSGNSGYDLVKSSTSGNCSFKAVKAGTGISMTNNTNDITFTNTGVISNSCSSPLSCSGTNPSSFSCSTCIVTGDSGTKYIQLCESSLNSANASLVCSGFTGKKHIVLDINIATDASGTAIVPGIRFNGDSGNNYAEKTSTNAGAIASETSVSACKFQGTNTIANSEGGDFYGFFMNVASIRKLGEGMSAQGINSASSSAPSTFEFWCKWDNTANQITAVSLVAISGTDKYTTGTDITVYGYD